MKAQKGYLFRPLGGTEGTVPPVLTGGNRTVRLISFVTENKVIFSCCRWFLLKVYHSINLFKYFLLVELPLILSYMHQSGLHVSKSKKTSCLSTFWIRMYCTCKRPLSVFNNGFLLFSLLFFCSSLVIS